MKDEKYISKLENAIKQMLLPLKDIPFNLVIEAITGKSLKILKWGKYQPNTSNILSTPIQR